MIHKEITASEHVGNMFILLCVIQYIWAIYGQLLVIPSIPPSSPIGIPYVVSIDNIVDPLYVFPDYGNDGVNYFCSLSYQRWGSYFTHKINQ